MVSNVVLLGAAVGVFQLSKCLPSPQKEILLVCVCLGALWASAILQRAQHPSEEPGPAPPKGWGRFAHRRADDDGLAGAEVLVLGESDGGSGAAADKAGPALVVLPGPLGVPHFYCSFAERLCKELCDVGSAPCAVYIVGLPCMSAISTVEHGHDSGLTYADEEAKDVAQILEELAQKHAPKLVLVAPSPMPRCVAPQLAAADGGASGTGPLRSSLSAFCLPQFEPPRSLAAKVGAVLLNVPAAVQLCHVAALALLTLPPLLQAAFVSVLLGREASEEQCAVAEATFLRRPHYLVALARLWRSAAAKERMTLPTVAQRSPVIAVLGDGLSIVPSAAADEKHSAGLGPIGDVVFHEPSTRRAAAAAAAAIVRVLRG